MPAFPAPAPSSAGPAPPKAEDALRSELVAALDHDLRTSLTTVLGALQTLARPELAPTDPDLAALLEAALAQAQKMRRLLDELPAAAAPGDAAPLLPVEITRLITQASEAGASAVVEAEVPDDLGEVDLSAPALRRTLAAIFGRVQPPGRAIRVAVGRQDQDCWFTISIGDGSLPSIPELAERLMAVMGGSIEQTGSNAPFSLRLVFPRALRRGSPRTGRGSPSSAPRTPRG